MPALDWNAFTQLPGAAETNFEKLCRAIVRCHYAQFGDFRELANQAGVEFHLRLKNPCDLGEPPRWYGWQCKWYQSTKGQKLGAARRAKIVDGLAKTKRHIPDLTDWVLWTRYTLPKEDQDWFYGLQAGYPFSLSLRTAADIDDLLTGPATLLRETYFGELILTPNVLAEQYALTVAPFRRRFQPEVHYEAPPEKTLRQYLGGQAAWHVLPDIAGSLTLEADDISATASDVRVPLRNEVDSLVEQGRNAARLLDAIYLALGVGDLDAIKQLLSTDFAQPSRHRKTLMGLRAARAKCSLSAANLVADLYATSSELTELRKSVAARMVGVLAAAGEGKSELAVQVTQPSGDFPGGVLLLGKDLHAGQDLDHLAGAFKISGRPVQTFERLVAALDAAGQRAGKRLPLIIDGLNEAEDPRNWKGSLYRAEELLRSYPYVLLVVTLRNEFDKDCLPEDIERLSLDGFKDDPRAAIERYFRYYKIDATDADLPLELLQHPLTLRIYCEVANPDRRHMVGVEALPRSLTTLFEVHFRKIAERVADLSPSSRRIYQDEVLEAMRKIAQLLWERNARSANDKEVRRQINDPADWNSSLVRSLESEGVLVRTSYENGKFGISFAYDLMAGYMIAQHLLHQEDFPHWLKEPSNLAKLTFSGPDAHTLAYDTFHTLVGLFPAHTHGRNHLWQALSGELTLYALLLTTEVDPSYINRETVDRFEQEMLRSSAFARAAYRQLRITRAANAHPLDANFLDQVLRAMSNTERDLSWSEGLRRDEDENIKDIEALRSRWASDGATRRELSRARWVMWTLTTNSRYLRDISTRALYTLALAAPQQYFDLAIESLTISDPYVAERALAAAYGAALAKWSDKGDEKMREALPKMAASLLHALFVPSAPTPTRHALLRQYCLGIIELGRRIDPKCVSEDEAQYLVPPFSHLPQPFVDPPRASPAQIQAADDAAISMDFGNYTFGRLIPDRPNYDYKHSDYAATRKAIVARMLDLGYDPVRLDAIDRNMRASSRLGREGRKVDRYGKKYGWIAFHEMWGWRADNNLLASWRAERRSSEADIDPTFPANARSWVPSLPEIFSGGPREMSDWIFGGPIPDYSCLLRTPHVDEAIGDWVLINGFVEETAPTDYREVFTFLRGIFVRNADVDLLQASFDEMRYPGNEAIPSGSEHHYTYAGEMPFEYPPGTPLMLDGPDRKTDTRVQISEDRWSEEGGISVEIPEQRYSWESYHSELNTAGGIFLPSAKLCQHLGLGYRPGQWDFYDDSGIASIYRDLGTGDISLSGHVVYLRADLLRRYLNDTGQTLVWLMWGERGQNYRGHHSDDATSRQGYAKDNHIHKRFAVWQQTEAQRTSPKTAARPRRRTRGKQAK